MSPPAGSATIVDLVDQGAYEVGPPFELLHRTRVETPVAWIDEPVLHG
jgi:hypothetical protein